MTKNVTAIAAAEAREDLVRTGPGMYIGRKTGGVYETSKQEVEPDAQQQNGSSGKPYARWGHDNNYPQRLIDTVMSDPAAGLLERRASLHYGAGIQLYRRTVEKNKVVITPLADDEVPAEIEDFLFANDWQNFMQGIIADFEWWHAFPVQYITSTDGKVLQVKWQRMKDVRPELRDKKTGTIKNYYLSGYWPYPQEGFYTTVPAFDRMGIEKGSGLYVHRLVSIDKDYFPQPAWHGITRWLHIAAKIPRWILSNIDNGMNIKYHVEVPLSYFLQRHPEEAYKTTEERNAAIKADEKEKFKEIDDYLAGEKNVGKAFFSKYATGDDGKPLPGWKINVLENKIQDEAWLRAYGTASMAIISGNGMNPSLAGTILPNGLGSGSGSDLREQFNFYMQVMTPQPRQTTLEPWEIIKRRNGWPRDIHMGYREVVLQSVNENKSGFNVQNEQSPTTDKTDQTMNALTV